MLRTKLASYIIYPILVITMFLPVKSVSQKGFSITYNYGKIVPHSDKIRPLVKDPVKGFAINYYISNKRGEEWRNFYNLPNYGLSYNFKSYGNPEILGNSHSLTAFLQMSILPIRWEGNEQAMEWLLIPRERF